MGSAAKSLTFGVVDSKRPWINIKAHGTTSMVNRLQKGFGIITSEKDTSLKIYNFL